MNLTDEERIAAALLEIAEILEKYQVEYCGDYEHEIWLEVVEPQKPDLRIVN